MPSIRAAAAASLLALAACGTDLPVEGVDPNISESNERTYVNRQKYGTLTGQDGINLTDLLLGRGGDEGEVTGGPAGVNGYLWRASLDTLQFMPLISTDPFGGVIVTDWYSPPESPAERFKLNVYVRDRALRADGLKISAFQQVRTREAGWVDAPTDPELARQLEDAILTQARELRIAQLGE